MNQPNDAVSPELTHLNQVAERTGISDYARQEEHRIASNGLEDISISTSNSAWPGWKCAGQGPRMDANGWEWGTGTGERCG